MGINEYIQIGSKIKEARLKSGITQKEMAQKLLISVSTYSNYENGYREPPLETIDRICRILGYSLDDLILHDKLVTIFESKHPTKTDKEIVKEFTNLGESPGNIVGYFKDGDFTESELEDLKRYAEFIKSKRPQELKEVGDFINTISEPDNEE